MEKDLRVYLPTEKSMLIIPALSFVQFEQSFVFSLLTTHQQEQEGTEISCISQSFCQTVQKHRFLILGELKMKMNAKAHYGLIAAAYIAEQADEGCVTAETISAKYSISVTFLFKVMQDMVKANVLRSKRGPRGGYTLARPAKEITLLEIIEAVDGPISTRLEIVELTKKAQFSIEMEKVCERAFEKAVSILGRAKLSQMVG